MKSIKTRLNLLILNSVVCALFVLGSCDKNDDPAPVIDDIPNGSGPNFTTVDGEKFYTPYGYMFDLGKPSKYDSRIFIVDLSNGYFDGSAYAHEMTSLISLDLNSQSQDELSEGTYTLLQEKDANDIPVRTPMTFTDVYMRTNLKYSNGKFTEGNFYEKVISGSVKVKKIATGYELDFDLIFEGNIQIKGHYEGELKYYYEE